MKYQLRKEFGEKNNNIYIQKKFIHKSKKSKVNEELNDDDNNKITKIDLIYNEPLTL